MSPGWARPPGKRQTAVMITKIEDYFAKGCGRCDRFDSPDCSTRQWAKGLQELRRICRDVKLEETVKWGHPCYMHAGRNIAIVGAFRDDFRLTFFNGALLQDPAGILERRGQNARHPDIIRFTANDQVDEMEGLIRSYLREAMRYAAEGIKPPKDDDEPDQPEELVEALNADPQLAEAYRNLTPGRQKSYIINLNSAKKPETRKARIARFRDRIIAGKGALER